MGWGSKERVLSSEVEEWESQVYVGIRDMAGLHLVTAPHLWQLWGDHGPNRGHRGAGRPKEALCPRCGPCSGALRPGRPGGSCSGWCWAWREGTDALAMWDCSPVVGTSRAAGRQAAVCCR